MLAFRRGVIRQPPIFHGIDVTGSIREGVVKGYHAGDLQILTAQMREAAAGTSVKPQLRIHAFESPEVLKIPNLRTHPFYNDVIAMLEDKATDDVTIRLGHVAALDTSEKSPVMQALKGRCMPPRTCNVLVEVNFASNKFLQNVDAKALVGKAHDLLRNGIPVVPGADGQGIIANSHIQDTLKEMRLRFPGDPLLDSVGNALSETSKGPGSQMSGAALKQKYLDDLATNMAKQLCN